jgi:Ca-activated chloride channel homolog
MRNRVGQFPCRLLLAAAIVVAAASLIAIDLRAQESIKIDVNLVTVSFSVRDAGGALVDGLTQDDFEVAEDSAPQKIAYFAKSTDIPLTLGLIVDASGSQDHFEKQHEHDLDTFLKAVLGPKDRAFLIGFGNHIRLVSDFSQSGNEMMQRWKEYEKHTDRFPELGPRESRDLGTAFYDSIFYSIEEKLAKENGRRALLIFSDGEDNSSSHDMMTTIEEAQ